MDEPYTCPACGTALFETCSSCENTRHSLLPNCHHCGAGKPDFNVSLGIEESS